MRLQQIRDFLWPVAPERDEGFHTEIERLGRRGLRVIGWIEIVMPVVGVAAHLAVVGGDRWFPCPFWPTLFSMVLGFATLKSADMVWANGHSRLVALASGVLSVILQTWSELDMVANGGLSITTGGIGILIVMLVGLAVLPLKPQQMFALGGVSWVVYVAATTHWVDQGWFSASAVNQWQVSSVPVMVGLCAVLSGVNYFRIHSTHASHKRALEASEELRHAESRTLIAESAASMGKLAAAVSHELNSPLGAMQSAAESLSLMAPKLQDADQTQRQRLAKLTEQLCGTVASSAERMAQIVARVQRVTNLDQAELQAVDVNQLLSDVTAMVRGQSAGEVRIETEFGSLPRVSCRPQPLSAVVSGLLQKASANAGDGGRVRVSTRRVNSSVEIAVRDSGPAIPPAELTRMFDPEFRVTSGRVTTGDWNLFSARRLVMELGGEIRAESHAADGTVFLVTLPLTALPT
ncbi:MAG: HAMP domain-containing histidine kinase [bacterium]|nr:HAMP domain-containing histidine kinase [bacterium]